MLMLYPVDHSLTQHNLLISPGEILWFRFKLKLHYSLHEEFGLKFNERIIPVTHIFRDQTIPRGIFLPRET